MLRRKVFVADTALRALEQWLKSYLLTRPPVIDILAQPRASLRIGSLDQYSDSQKGFHHENSIHSFDPYVRRGSISRLGRGREELEWHL